ncbi:MAG: hypothetical protein HYY22_04395 [Thaumarchaeota archaeon]|nr:hypothetical protein [Nitrososphaerota archaeon]
MAIWVIPLFFFIFTIFVITSTNVTYGLTPPATCFKCHYTDVKPTNIPNTQDCWVSCHQEKPDVEQVHSGHTIDVSPVETKIPSCATCHLKYTCSNCHQLHPAPVSTDCKSCHGKDPSNSPHNPKNGLHPPEGVECAVCHDTHKASFRPLISNITNAPSERVPAEQIPTEELQDTPVEQPPNTERENPPSPPEEIPLPPDAGDEPLQTPGYEGSPHSDHQLPRSSKPAEPPIRSNQTLGPNGESPEEPVSDNSTSESSVKTPPFMLAALESTIVQTHLQVLQPVTSMFGSSVLAVNVIFIIMAMVVIGGLIFRSFSSEEATY